MPPAHVDLCCINFSVWKSSLSYQLSVIAVFNSYILTFLQLVISFIFRTVNGQKCSYSQNLIPTTL